MSKQFNPAEAGDTELALAAQSGNLDAFEEIVRRHQGRVYATAYRVTGNREDALDVAQDALIKAYQKIGSWAPTGNFLSWLLRLTSNQAIDHLRRRKRHQTEPLDEGRTSGDESVPLEAQAPLPDALVRGMELDERVRAALVGLSPMQRDVFMLRHFEEFSLAEIAGQMGCTVGSVKVHLFRALKKLRAALGDFAPETGGGEEEAE